MDWKKELKICMYMVIAFVIFFHLPAGNPRFDNAVSEALKLTRCYALYQRFSLQELSPHLLVKIRS